MRQEFPGTVITMDATNNNRSSNPNGTQHGHGTFPPRNTCSGMQTLSAAQFADDASRMVIRSARSLPSRQTQATTSTADEQRQPANSTARMTRPLDAFHYFMRLPKELQIHIFDLAIESSYNDGTLHAQMCGKAMRINDITPMLHANRLVRDVAFDALRAFCLKNECKEHIVFFPEHSEAQFKRSLWIVDRISAPQDKWLEIRDFRHKYVEISEKEKKHRVQLMHVEHRSSLPFGLHGPPRKFLLRCDVGSVDASEIGYEFTLSNQPYEFIDVYLRSDTYGINECMANKIGCFLAKMNRPIRGNRLLIRAATKTQMRLNDDPAHISARAGKN